MARLTEKRYDEYMQLLKAWVAADKALEGPGAPDPEAQEQARRTREAVDRFRSAHGLVGAPAMAEGNR